MELIKDANGTEGDTNRLLLVADVARILGISKAAVYNMRVRGEIPFIKIGSRLRFDPVEIALWIEAKKSAVA
jgi:excisionase family DNA binding protein